MATQAEIDRGKKFLDQVEKSNLTKRPTKKHSRSLFSMLPDIVEKPIRAVVPNVIERDVGRVTRDQIRFFDQISRDLLNTPGGAIQLAKAGLLDWRDLPAAATGHGRPLKREITLGKGMLHETLQHLEHPERNIGHLGLDIATLYAPGAGRVAGAARAFKAAGKGLDAAGAERAVAPQLDIPETPTATQAQEVKDARKAEKKAARQQVAAAAKIVRDAQREQEKAARAVEKAATKAEKDAARKQQREADKAARAVLREQKKALAKAAREAEKANTPKAQKIRKKGQLAYARQRRTSQAKEVKLLQKKYDSEQNPSIKKEHKKKLDKALRILENIHLKIEELGGGVTSDPAAVPRGPGYVPERAEGPYIPPRVTSKVNEHGLVQWTAPLHNGDRFGIFSTPSGYRFARVNKNGTPSFLPQSAEDIAAGRKPVPELFGAPFKLKQNATKALLETAREHHAGEPLSIYDYGAAKILQRDIEGPDVKPGMFKGPRVSNLDKTVEQIEADKTISENTFNINADNLKSFVDKDVKPSKKMLAKVKKDGIEEGEIILQSYQVGSEAHLIGGPDVHEMINAAIELKQKVPVVVRRMRGKDDYGGGPKLNRTLLARWSRVQPGEMLPELNPTQYDLEGNVRTPERDTAPGAPQPHKGPTREDLEEEQHDLHRQLTEADGIKDPDVKEAIVEELENRLEKIRDEIAMAPTAEEAVAKYEEASAAHEENLTAYNKKRELTKKEEGLQKDLKPGTFTFRLVKGPNEQIVIARTADEVAALAKNNNIEYDRITKGGKNVTPEHTPFKFTAVDATGKDRPIEIVAATLEDAQAEFAAELKSKGWTRKKMVARKPDEQMVKTASNATPITFPTLSKKLVSRDGVPGISIEDGSVPNTKMIVTRTKGGRPMAIMEMTISGTQVTKLRRAVSATWRNREGELTNNMFKKAKEAGYDLEHPGEDMSGGRAKSAANASEKPKPEAERVKPTTPVEESGVQLEAPAGEGKAPVKIPHTDPHLEPNEDAAYYEHHLGAHEEASKAIVEKISELDKAKAVPDAYEALLKATGWAKRLPKSYVNKTAKQKLAWIVKRHDDIVAEAKGKLKKLAAVEKPKPVETPKEEAPKPEPAKPKPEAPKPEAPAKVPSQADIEYAAKLSDKADEMEPPRRDSKLLKQLDELGDEDISGAISDYREIDPKSEDYRGEEGREALDSDKQGAWEEIQQLIKDHAEALDDEAAQAKIAAEKPIEPAKAAEEAKPSDEFAPQVAKTEKPKKAAEPKPTAAVKLEDALGTHPGNESLFHGSPEGMLEHPDPLHFTQPWREGPGFYLTHSKEKAQKYAEGKTARAERKANTGEVTQFSLHKSAKIFDFEKVSPELWAKIVQDVIKNVTGDTGEFTVKDWESWRSDILDDPRVKGASPGIVNRVAFEYIMARYLEHPMSEAYHYLDDYLSGHGFNVTRHMEGDHPVYIAKEPEAIVHGNPDIEATRVERQKQGMQHTVDAIKADRARIQKTREELKKKQTDLHTAVDRLIKRGAPDAEYTALAEKSGMMPPSGMLGKAKVNWVQKEINNKIASHNEDLKRANKNLKHWGDKIKALDEEATLNQSAAHLDKMHVDYVNKAQEFRNEIQKLDDANKGKGVGAGEGQYKKLVNNTSEPVPDYILKAVDDNGNAKSWRARAYMQARHLEQIATEAAGKSAELKGEEPPLPVGPKGQTKKAKRERQAKIEEAQEQNPMPEPEQIIEEKVWPISHRVEGQLRVSQILGKTADEALAKAKQQGMSQAEIIDIGEISPKPAQTTGMGRKQKKYGVNERKLIEMGVPSSMHAEVRAKIMAVWKQAHDSGLDSPNFGDLRKVLTDSLGPEDGLKAWDVYSNTVGGAGDVPFNVQLAAAVKAFIHPETGGWFTIGTEDKTRLGVTQAIPANIVLSNSPWVRQLQLLRYSLMINDNPALRTKVLKAMFHAGDRAKNKKIRAEVRKIERHRDDMLGAEELKDSTLKEIQRKYWAAKRKNPGLRPIDYFDTASQIATIAAVQFKPAYFAPNFVGQVVFMMADHAWNPFSAARSSKLAWDHQHAFPDDKLPVRGAMQHSMSNTIANARRKLPGASWHVARASQNLAHWYSIVLDSPFRDNAFYHEARRQGFTTPEMVHELISNPEYGSKMYEISQRANANIIDYSLYTDFEQKFVRRAVFFYPWIKGASKYSARFYAIHPAQAALTTALSIQAQKELKKELGDLPSYLQGSFVVGHQNVKGIGRQPLIINPASLTILGTLGQTISAGKSFITGSGGQADQPAEFLNPIVSAGVAAATGQDPFTKKSYPSGTPPWNIFFQKMGTNFSMYESYKAFMRARDYESGKKPTDKVLFPNSTGQVIGKGLVGSYPRSLNKPESQSRAAAEASSLLSKPERLVLKSQDYQKKFAEAATKAGITVTPELRKAITVRGDRLANQAAWSEQLGRKLDAKDKLIADVSFLVQRGDMTDAKAKQYLGAWARLPDSSLRKIDSKLAAAYMMSTLLSRYLTAINKVLDVKFEPKLTSLGD